MIALLPTSLDDRQTEACTATLAFPCVDGCYLPKQENDFVHAVIEELEAFIQRDQQKSILLFPPLPSRLRYLTHKTAENHPCLSTFSVGPAGWSRRVVVCFSHLRLAPADGSDSEGGAGERSRARGGGMESGRGERASESRPTRTRRRPDKAIYVPRAMRERAGQSSPAPPTSDTPTPQTTPPAAQLTQSAPAVTATPTLLDTPTPRTTSTTAHLPHSAPPTTIAPPTPPSPPTGSPSANQEPASDLLLGDSGDPPSPGDSSLGPWEQTVSYFIAMSLDNQSDDGIGISGSAHPDGQVQTEGLKDSEDYLQEIAGQLAEADFAVESVRGDYSGFESLWIAPGEFSHVIEIYDFPAVFKTDDLLDAFAEFSEGGLKIKWVDNTHALGVFSSESAAVQALCLQHPLVKVRTLCEASKKSKGKALRRAEFIQPVKERPRTDTAVARRMVTRALGLPKPAPRGKRC